MALTLASPAAAVELQDVPGLGQGARTPARKPARKSARSPAAVGGGSSGGWEYGQPRTLWMFGLETGAELHFLAGVQRLVEDAGAPPPLGVSWGLSATRAGGGGSRLLIRGAVRAANLISRKLDVVAAPQIVSERREGDLSLGWRLAGAGFGGMSDGVRGLLWLGAGYGWISRLRAQDDYGDLLELAPGGAPHAVVGLEALWTSERRGVGAGLYVAYRHRGALQVVGLADPVSLSQVAAGAQVAWVLR